MDIQEMREKLKDRRISVVSKETDVNEATLRAILRGANENPTYKVFKAIEKYLTGEER